MVPYGADSLLVTAIILPFLSIIAVSLRIYVRLGMRHTYMGADDWLVIFSVLLVCGQGVMQILGKSFSLVIRGRVFLIRSLPPPQDLTEQQVWNLM